MNEFYKTPGKMGGIYAQKIAFSLLQDS